MTNYNYTLVASATETISNMHVGADRRKYELRINYFSHRIVPIWNSLPDNVVSAESVNTIKSRLDKFWSFEPIEPIHFLLEVKCKS